MSFPRHLVSKQWTLRLYWERGLVRRLLLLNPLVTASRKSTDFWGFFCFCFDQEEKILAPELTHATWRYKWIHNLDNRYEIVLSRVDAPFQESLDTLKTDEVPTIADPFVAGPPYNTPREYERSGLENDVFSKQNIAEILYLCENVKKPGDMGTYFALATSSPTEQMLSKNGWYLIENSLMGLWQIEMEKSKCSSARRKTMFRTICRSPCVTSTRLSSPSISGDWDKALTITSSLWTSTRPLCIWQVLFLGNQRIFGDSQTFLLRDGLWPRNVCHSVW